MAPRRRTLGAAAVLLAALAYGLLRPQRPPQAPPPTGPQPALSAPGDPGRMDAGSPLDGEAPASEALTNEQLHKTLEEESERLGLRVIGRQDREEPSSSYLGPRLGLPGSREQAEAAIRELAAMRRGIEASSGKPETVPVGGRTAQLLSSPPEDSGAAVGPRSDAPGSWTGQFSAIEAGQRTVDTDSEWRELWAGLSRDPAPEVDFARRQVVAVFLGPRPTGGYSVEIAKVVPAGTHRLVEYREKAPRGRESLPAWADGPSAPYALRSIERAASPIRFRKLP